MPFELHPLPLSDSIDLESRAIQRQLARAHRPTAMKYLDALVAAGFLLKTRLGRSNFYVNQPLLELLSR